MHISYDLIDNIILPHLNFKTLRSFSWVNKYYYKKINAFYFVNKKLKEIFGEDLKTFKKILQETKSVISGSFILQCLLKVEWENSDIDIFCKDEPTKGLYNFLQNKLVIVPSSQKGDGQYVHPNKGSFTVVDFSYEKEFLDNKKEIDNAMSTNQYEYWKLTHLPCNYRVQAKGRVQLITSDDTSPIKDLIIDGFDFDIIKNYYHITKKGDEKIHINSPKDIKTKSTHFREYLYEKQNVLLNFAEHEKNDPPNGHTFPKGKSLHSSKERAEMRINKYEKRGIKIIK